MASKEFEILKDKLAYFGGYKWLPYVDAVELINENEKIKQTIEDVYKELNKAKDKNNKLRERNDYIDNILASYKTENKALKNRLHFEASYNEKLQERIEQLEKGYKDILSWGNLGSTYSDISAAITFQDIARKTLVGYKEDK